MLFLQDPALKHNFYIDHTVALLVLENEALRLLRPMLGGPVIQEDLESASQEVVRTQDDWFTCVHTFS